MVIIHTRDRWVELRKGKNLTQEQLAVKLGIQRSTYSNYELGKREPDFETAKLIADFFEVSVDYLLGNSTYRGGERADHGLSYKEELDVAKDVERLIGKLESNNALAFHGEPMDDETKRLMQISLENSMRLAKEMAKKKFTPNKYKK